MDNIKWCLTKDGCYTAYIVDGNQSWSFEVFRDGSYRGTSVTQVPGPTKEVIISGKAFDIKDALDMIDRFFSKKPESDGQFLVSESSVPEQDASKTRAVSSESPEVLIETVAEPERDLSCKVSVQEGGVSFLVELISAAGHKVKYTLDGKTPAMNSKTYKEPFIVEAGVTVKAASFDGDRNKVDCQEFEV